MGIFKHPKNSLLIRAIAASLCVTLGLMPSYALSKERIEYRTIEGDTLSDIVWALVPGRLYGKQGALLRVIQINPHLQDPNHLEPNTMVILPNDSKFVVERIGRMPASIKNSNFLVRDQVELRLRTIASEKVESLEHTQEKPPTFTLKKAFLELNPSFQGTSIRISDSISGPSATFSSRTNFGLSARYIQAWSDQFHTFLGFGLNYVNFQVPQNALKTMSESSVLTTSMSAGGRFFFSDQTFFTLLFAQQQELFIRATSSTNFAVSTLPVYSFNGRLDHNLFQVRPFTIGVAGEANVYFGTQGDSYTASAGTGFGGILYLKQDGESRDGGKNYDGFQSEIRFFSKNQNTTGVEQSEQNLSLILRFFIPVGARAVKE